LVDSSPVPILGFGRNDATDATTRVRDVAGITRDHMEMELEHGLAGSGAIIEAEVEGVRRRAQIDGQELLCPVNPNEKSCLFGGGEVVEPSDWPAGDNQGVTRRDGEFVGNDREEVVEGSDPSRFDFSENGECQGGAVGESEKVQGVGQYLTLRCFAPAEACCGRVELLIARRYDRSTSKRGQVSVGSHAGLKTPSDLPCACFMDFVRTGRDEEAVHGPVVVGAKGEAVVGSVVLGFIEGDNVGGFDERDTF